MIFFGKIEDGKLKTNKTRIDEYIKSLKKGKVKIEIKKVRAIRSLQQNNLYWRWIDIISKDTGYLGDELHATFRSMYLTDHSKKFPIVRSTTVLNKIQFGQYLDKIDRKMSEFGILLPQPDNDFY